MGQQADVLALFLFVQSLTTSPYPEENRLVDPVAAQMLLLKCRGDEIWPEHECVSAGVPQRWIDELVDQYESGFDTNLNTIYVDDGNGEHVTNQFRGVSDLLLAYKIAEHLSIDWRRETGHLIDRVSKVNALKEALDEL